MAHSSAKDDSPEGITALVSALCAELQSPNARALCSAVELGDWEAVVQLKADPRNYTSARAYYEDVVPTFLKKAQDLPIKVDRQRAALTKWWEAEHQCFRSNQRLYSYLPGKVQYLQEDLDVSRHLGGIRKIIQSWIGVGPSRPEYVFSPGSSLTDRGHRATVAHKIHKNPSSTYEYDAAGYPGFIGTLWHHNMVDARRTPTLVRGGEFFTVPKTALVDRCAELQPSLNVSAQLGAGQDLRRRLKNATGWDLKRAQETHRKVAEISSVDQSFCTIDLSSASDTVGRVLVELLLPARWFVHLDGLRTHRIKGVIADKPDSYVYMEKFSSMGNGFTFELETIIFAAVCCYVTRLNGYYGELGFDVFTYGDDIIVRDELYSQVVAILGFLGFSINPEKSFHGPHPFRESCGADFFAGVNVRNAYLEKAFDHSIQEQISVVNQVGRISRRLKAMGHNGVNRCWFTAISHLPRWVRDCRGPEELGDSVIQDLRKETWMIRTRTKKTPVTGISFQVEGYWELETVEIKTVAFEPPLTQWIPWARFDPATILTCAVLGFGDGLRGILPRKPDLLPSTKWVPILLDRHTG